MQASAAGAENGNHANSHITLVPSCGDWKNKIIPHISHHGEVRKAFIEDVRGLNHDKGRKESRYLYTSLLVAGLHKFSKVNCFRKVMALQDRRLTRIETGNTIY